MDKNKRWHFFKKVFDHIFFNSASHPASHSLTELRLARMEVTYYLFCCFLMMVGTHTHARIDNLLA
jgi:hypothetical protein